jgi:hypothetical protein
LKKIHNLKSNQAKIRSNSSTRQAAVHQRSETSSREEEKPTEGRQKSLVSVAETSKTHASANDKRRRWAKERKKLIINKSVQKTETTRDGSRYAHRR